MSVLAPAAAAHPWLTHAVTVRRVRREVEGVATYHLGFDDPAVGETFEYRPGQFNMLYLPGIGDTPISISGHNAAEGTLAHTVRVAGNTTRALERLGERGSLGLRGPFGTAWPLDEAAGQDVVLVTGGIGLAPLRPVVLELLANRGRYGRLSLLYGARTPASMLYAEEFENWTNQGVNLFSTVDRSVPGWLGNVGVVTLLVDRLRPLRPEHTLMMVCGPEVMMRYVVRSALDRGLSERQIWLSLERNMQCAVGHCGHCQLGPAFICKDGPVFRHDRIGRYLEVEAL
jgi:NAD(P)H-flavin reductase